MATRALLPILCIMFLLSTSSLMLPSAEAVRTLEETKTQTKPDGTISPGVLNPGTAPKTPRGQPYTPPCKYKYRCPPSEAEP